MGNFSESLAPAASDIVLELLNGVHHTTISRRSSTCAKGGGWMHSAWWKQSSYKFECMGGRKNIIVPFFFACCCTAREVKCTNRPMLAYPPGEVAYANNEMISIPMQGKGV